MKFRWRDASALQSSNFKMRRPTRPSSQGHARSLTATATIVSNTVRLSIAERAGVCSLHVSSGTNRLPDRRDGRDSLSARRRSPHCRRVRLCRAAAAGAAREAARLGFYFGRRAEDSRSEAGSGAYVFRPAGRHRRRIDPQEYLRACIQPARHRRHIRHDPHARRDCRRNTESRSARKLPSPATSTRCTNVHCISRAVPGSTSRSGTSR